ncbi:MAG: hypothetical protein SWH78_12045 [Thermodesulfobacteriota bacterium]|nr:hypothetical protein [Thermodesulfobacteriota bacterium]
MNRNLTELGFLLQKDVKEDWNHKKPMGILSVSVPRQDESFPGREVGNDEGGDENSGQPNGGVFEFDVVLRHVWIDGQ